MYHAGGGSDSTGLGLWAQAWTLSHLPLAAKES